MKDERKTKKKFIKKTKGLEQDLLELNRQDGASRADQAKLRAFANASPDVMLIMDEKGTYVEILTSQNQLLVSAPEDLLGKNVREVLSKDEADLFMKIIKQSLETSSPQLVEYELTVQDGKKWFEGRCSQIDGIKESLVVFVTRDITERKKAEEALRASEETSRALLNAPTDSAILVDTQGTILAINDVAATRLGGNPEEFIGLGIWDYLPPDLAKSRKDYGDRVVRTGKTFRFQDERNGRRFDNNVYPVTNDAGQVTALAVYARDITEQVGAEEQIRFQAKLLDNVQEGVIAADLAGKITYWGQGAEVIYGSTAEEMIGKSISVFLAPGSDQSNERRLQQVVENEAWRGIVEQRHKSGKTIWADVTISLVSDNEGRPQGYLGINKDITEQRSIEISLREKNEEIRSIVESSRDWIWSIDLEGRHTFSNPVVYDILGYSVEEIVGGSSLELMHEEDRKSVESKLPKWVESKEGWNQLVIRWKHKKGGWRWLESNAVPILDRDGNFIGFRGVDRDITERKRTERLILALNQAALAMESAMTPEDTFEAVAQELHHLGFSSMLFPLDESGTKLLTKYVSYDSKMLKAVEKMAGLKLKEFAINLDRMDLYRDIVQEKKAVLVEDTKAHLRKALPKNMRKLAPKIIKMLEIPKSIPAPLIVDGNVIGIFSVMSDDLTPEDIPTIVAFADQMAAAFRKAGLMADLEASLAEVVQAREEIKDNLETLQKTLDGTVNALASTVEKKDPYTSGHQEVVTGFAVAIAQELGLPEETIEGLRVACVLHDIGKIYVPAEILNKPGKLSDMEMKLIKTHPIVGREILETVEFPWPVADIVVQHHERMDGSGYPAGLSGKDILIEARVLAVADVVNAISSHRPYRPALGLDVAIDELTRQKGILYDSQVVEVALKLMAKGEIKFA